MSEFELVFFPSPVMGHIAQLIDLAKVMVDRDVRLQITFFLVKMSMDPVSTNFIDSLMINNNNDHRNIKFLLLPHIDPSSDWKYNTTGTLLHLLVQHHKPNVRRAVAQILAAPATGSSSRISAFVVDMLCTPIIDVADEFSIPSYIFFTSNAAFLGLMLHFQDLHDNHAQQIPDLENSKTDLIVPSFEKSVPPSVLPFVLMDPQCWCTRFLIYARGYRKAKGIIVNTFVDIEPYALRSLLPQSGPPGSSTSSHIIPPIYPVGPMLNQTKNEDSEHSESSDSIIAWLDQQPQSSVVFLCFGTRGVFQAEQIKEIAHGLEESGYRFLWSIRRPSGGKGFPGDYSGGCEEVLPVGFLERTKEQGMVITGWVPQLAVLSHGAIGGFVSHCGWNSLLESIWCGVPVATWPIYAEQQLNAFQMVRELGLAVEIKLDYEGTGFGKNRHEVKMIVCAEEVERGIRELMKSESPVRERVKNMKEKSRTALAQGGASYISLGNVIQQIIMP